MAQQYILPEWARRSAARVDPRTSPYWAAQDVGSGSGTMGSGDGSGYYGPLEQFAGRQVGSGDGQYGTAPDISGAIDWLNATGQQVFEANGGNNENARWLQDAQGNITAEPQVREVNDDAFWNGALAAAAITGANLYGAYGGAGAVAEGGAAAGMPEAGIKTMGTIAPGTEALSPLATTGQLSTAPLITASIPQAGGGLFGTSLLGQAANGLLDYAKANPKVVVGGLLGAIGGASGGGAGGGEAPYAGPMPTIERGGWKPRVQAQQMALPQFGGAKTTPGAAGSGLWRFMGNK